MGPVRYTLVGNAPQSQLRIKRTSQEESIIAWMELDRSDEVTMLEAAQAFRPADMP